MGIYITLGIVFALFIGAAYIAARLDDKLHEKENLVKSLLNDIAALQAKLKQNGIEL